MNKDLLEDYRVIGLMSGSSLDGLDIACCDFSLKNGKWEFSIEDAACIDYDEGWIRRLSEAARADGKNLWQLHADFGRFCGIAVRNFIDANKIDHVSFVSSHGHTIFHFPKQRFTTQLGDGAALAAEAGLPVVCDFRSIDVAKSGQGAPLVPVGDKVLFADYRFLLNIGGIANITIQGEKTVAFDVCSANQVLNFYAHKKGQAYDAEGALAEKGQLHKELFDRLNLLPFYSEDFPKSLDNAYSRDVVIPLMEQYDVSVENKLHTFCDHIAYQIAAHAGKFKPLPQDKLLATGGGAFNTHLMKRLGHYCPLQITHPDKKIIAYKEALIFALMGVLRWRKEKNIYRTVTGAATDSIAGAIYFP